MSTGGKPYLVGDLELLALSDVGGLGHSSLESVQGLVVQRLYVRDTVSIIHIYPLSDSIIRRLSLFFLSTPQSMMSNPRTLPPVLGVDMITYRSARDGHLDLAARGAHQLAEPGADGAQQRQAVVLGQGLQEVLDGLAAAAGLLELGDDGGLVGGRQHGRLEDLDQLGVLGHQVGQLVHGVGGRVEGRGLGGGRVL